MCCVLVICVSWILHSNIHRDLCEQLHISISLIAPQITKEMAKVRKARPLVVMKFSIFCLFCFCFGLDNLLFLAAAQKFHFSPIKESSSTFVVDVGGLLLLLMMLLLLLPHSQTNRNWICCWPAIDRRRLSRRNCLHSCFQSLSQRRTNKFNAKWPSNMLHAALLAIEHVAFACARLAARPSFVLFLLGPLELALCCLCSPSYRCLVFVFFHGARFLFLFWPSQLICCAMFWSLAPFPQTNNIITPISPSDDRLSSSCFVIFLPFGWKFLLAQYRMPIQCMSGFLDEMRHDSTTVSENKPAYCAN